MLKNLKHSILFILIVVTILLIAVMSLAASKPVSIDTATVSVQKENNLKSGKWSGLGMQVLSTKNDAWELSATFDDDVDVLLANGFKQLRLDLIQHNVDTDLINISKSAVVIGVAKGADMIWGLTCMDTMTATHWATYRLDVLSAATWAQANGVYEFLIGNEIEQRVDGTTITVAQLIANVKSLATEVKAIFTNGNISYSTQPDYLNAWIAAGKGDLDLLGLNLYLGWGTNPATYDEAVFISRLSDLVSTFGTSGCYLSEFGLSVTSVNSYSTDEVVQASMMASLIDNIIYSGITRASFFNYLDDPRPFGAVGFGALKTDGTYRELWDVLTSNDATLDNTAPNITGLSNDTTKINSKTWAWGADEPATFRYLIDDKPDSIPTGDYSDTTTATQSDVKNGTYYIHVQAKDMAGNESGVVTVSAIMKKANNNKSK